MSAFSSLFSGAKVDETVNDLLNKSLGPVGRQDVRPRTVVEVPEETASTDKTSGSQAEGAVAKPVDASEPVEAPKKRKSLKKKRGDDDENEALEAEYYAKVTGEPESSAEEEQKVEAAGSDQEAPESSATKTPADRKLSVAKSVDLKEVELQKAERTVFVGNVSNKVISSKTTYKDFKKILRNIGSVESIRFRSIAFDEALPRKVAFARKNLHDSRDTLNAYVVYKEKEASLKAPERLNATVFDHNHIRVDHVAHPSPKDNKRTIFVGNLDFEEKEESLWRYFNSKVDDDVESVRVVRDAKTNMGKGFALVQFKDTLSVNKALLLNDKPMTSEGKKPRKLRISRAKNNAKPSVISPNHFDNMKKTQKPKARLTDDQKTKIGRAKKLLGKADRSSAGQMVAEGSRASKGQTIAGIKGLKSAQGRVKKPRITKRSTLFKQDRKKFENLH
ncbi:nucleolar protein 12 [Metschnikowia bicuspidata var. bicuspidata NRRL YB-4993]|uniref:Nucleolar protein 12 n=1 Tax=Metschnikowia bicuspidata var. bicuspidata NRRL YB-4993 TaxID=869754 RepID=A0A1A0HDB5_9ASCO|nr:nucleolar protein 12 [Metschnikowia bicuspidata var. bicuspidata NRRL YB-4993]OBA21965.1 nucleolar protein 12 [Metschnikowia bicuspidata var. bicuspidata NRRL YB-4993]